MVMLVTISLFLFHRYLCKISLPKVKQNTFLFILFACCFSELFYPTFLFQRQYREYDQRLQAYKHFFFKMSAFPMLMTEIKALQCFFVFLQCQHRR